jgi:hypothetical protein
VIEDVRIVGNNAVSNASIRNLIRTRVGEKLDLATVEEDTQRVYGLRKFANVIPRVEPSATGVIVIYEVQEQRQIKEITFKGNTALDEDTLRDAVDLKVGESIDRFRIDAFDTALLPMMRTSSITRPFSPCCPAAPAAGAVAAPGAGCPNAGVPPPRIPLPPPHTTRTAMPAHASFAATARVLSFTRCPVAPRVA